MHEQPNPAFYSTTFFFSVRQPLSFLHPNVIYIGCPKETSLIIMSTFFCTEYHLVKQNKKHSITENRMILQN